MISLLHYTMTENDVKITINYNHDKDVIEQFCLWRKKFSFFALFT